MFKPWLNIIVWKKATDELDQDFSKIFNKVYNYIPAHIKPPPGSSQLHYVEAFDNDFSNLLREREYASLADMKNDVVKFEVNMVATKRSTMGKAILKEEEKHFSSSEVKFDTMMNTMERLMNRISLGTNTLPATQQET